MKKQEPKGWNDLAREYGVSVRTFRKWLTKEDWIALLEVGYTPYSGYILMPKVVAKIYEIINAQENGD